MTNDPWSRLSTELSHTHPRVLRLDALSSAELADLFDEVDADLFEALKRPSVRRAVARAITFLERSFRAGGSLHYFGAGTSGRLGVLDASECPPTFGVERSRVQGHIAGGREALVRSIEGAEDKVSVARADFRAAGITKRDVVVGITACGLAAYVHEALRLARKRGADTILISCAGPRGLKNVADILIAPKVGPELIAGSTRMKAGTATKMILNRITTGAMIRLGKTYGPWMVDVKPWNKKLEARQARLVSRIAEISPEKAGRVLKAAGRDVKRAVVMAVKSCGCAEADALLDSADGSLRRVIEP